MCMPTANGWCRVLLTVGFSCLCFWLQMDPSLSNIFQYWLVRLLSGRYPIELVDPKPVAKKERG